MRVHGEQGSGHGLDAPSARGQPRGYRTWLGELLLALAGPGVPGAGRERLFELRLPLAGPSPAPVLAYAAFRR